MPLRIATPPAQRLTVSDGFGNTAVVPLMGGQEISVDILIEDQAAISVRVSDGGRLSVVPGLGLVAGATVGVATAAANVNGVASSVAAVEGASTGAATVSAAGADAAATEAAGTAAGLATVSAQGVGTAASVGAASGLSVVSATSGATAAGEGVGTGSAAATANATGASTVVAAGNVVAFSTVSSAGASIAATSGAAAGAASASGAASSGAANEATGAAVGLAAVSGVGRSIAAAAGAADGAAAVSGLGTATVATVGAADGAAAVAGSAGATVSGLGVSDGLSTVSAAGRATVGQLGISDAAATVSGVGEAVSGELITRAAGPAGSADFKGETLDAGWYIVENSVFPAPTLVEGDRLEWTLPAASTQDPGTGTNAGVNTTRVVTDIGDGDWTMTVKLDTHPTVFSSRRLMSAGFYVGNFDNTQSMRVEEYASADTDGLGSGIPFYYIQAPNAGVVNSSNSNYGLKGVPGYMRLAKVGDDYTYSVSWNGTDFTTQATWTDAMVVANAGFYFAHSSNQFRDGKGAIDYIHVGGHTLPTLNFEPTRTTLLDETFADLSNWYDDSEVSATAVVNAGVLEIDKTAATGSTARIATRGTYGPDVGIVFRYRGVGTPLADDSYLAVGLRGYNVTSTGRWGNQYCSDVALAFEGRVVDGEVRILMNYGDDDTADGGRFRGEWYFGTPAVNPSLGWVWVRLEAIGPFIRYRTWSDGDAEPTTWTLEDVVDDFARVTGRVGIAFTHNDGVGVIDAAEITDLEIYGFTEGNSAFVPDAGVVSAEGTATGVATVEAVGNSTASAPGTANGAATASGVGEAVTAGGGSSGNFTFTVADGYAVINSSDPASVSLTAEGFPLVEGNLLVAVGMDRNVNTMTSYTITDESGETWQKRAELSNAVSGNENNTRLNMVVWTRIVTASDGAGTVTIDDGTGNSKGALIMEIQPSAPFAFDFVGAEIKGSGASDFSGNTTAPVAAAGSDMLEIALAANRNGIGGQPADFSAPHDDGLTGDAGFTNTTSTWGAITGVSTGPGDKTATVQRGGGNTDAEGIVCLLVFRDSAI